VTEENDDDDEEEEEEDEDYTAPSSSVKVENTEGAAGSSPPKAVVFTYAAVNGHKTAPSDLGGSQAEVVPPVPVPKGPPSTPAKANQAAPATAAPGYFAMAQVGENKPSTPSGLRSLAKGADNGSAPGGLASLQPQGQDQKRLNKQLNAGAQEWVPPWMRS